jgi:hypothetical protein
MAKETHLQMIQGVISRMAQNSFAMKGWAVTLVSLAFALAAKDTNTKVGLVAYIAACMFWFLDAYYLQQERLFRLIYEYVCTLADNAIDYSMKPTAAIEHATKDQKERLAYLCNLFSRTESGFYVPLLLVVTLGNWVVGAIHF